MPKPSRAAFSKACAACLVCDDDIDNSEVRGRVQQVDKSGNRFSEIFYEAEFVKTTEEWDTEVFSLRGPRFWMKPVHNRINFHSSLTPRLFLCLELGKTPRNSENSSGSLQSGNPTNVWMPTFERLRKNLNSLRQTTARPNRSNSQQTACCDIHGRSACIRQQQ